jgi:hypothetical protein
MCTTGAWKAGLAYTLSPLFSIMMCRHVSLYCKHCVVDALNDQPELQHMSSRRDGLAQVVDGMSDYAML